MTTKPKQRIYDGVTIEKRGRLSKSHVFKPGAIPLAIQQEQLPLVEVLLFEKNSTPLKDYVVPDKGMPPCQL